MGEDRQFCSLFALVDEGLKPSPIGKWSVGPGGASAERWSPAALRDDIEWKSRNFCCSFADESKCNALRSLDLAMGSCGLGASAWTGACDHSSDENERCLTDPTEKFCDGIFIAAVTPAQGLQVEKDRDELRRQSRQRRSIRREKEFVWPGLNDDSYWLY